MPPAVVDEDSELGRRYIAAMELAGRYAYAGREWVVERVRQIIGGSRDRHGPQPPQLRLARDATAGATSGWSARARRRPSPASAASSAARWATTP